MEKKIKGFHLRLHEIDLPSIFLIERELERERERESKWEGIQHDVRTGI